MKIYLHGIQLMYPKQVVGILLDYAPSHSQGLLEWVKKENELSETKIVIEFVDECLTSIYQPCDVVVNKPLKLKI